MKTIKDGHNSAKGNSRLLHYVRNDRLLVFGHWSVVRLFIVYGLWSLVFFLLPSFPAHAQTVELKKIFMLDAYSVHDRFNNPEDMLYDRKRNRILVADTNNHKIHLFTRDGFMAGQVGIKNELEFPVRIGISSKGILYAIEGTTQRIKRFGPKLEPLENLDVSALLPEEKQDEPKEKKEKKKIIPILFTLDSRDNFYVVDEEQRIFVFSKEETFLFSVNGEQAKANPFKHIADIQISPDGEMVILDAGKTQDIIQIFDKKGKFIRAFGKKGEGFSDLSSPVSVSVDRQNRIWVVDEGCQCIKVFEKTSLYLFSFGGIGSLIEFFYPRRVVFDDFGRVYILEKGDGKVGVYEVSGTLPP